MVMSLTGILKKSALTVQQVLHVQKKMKVKKFFYINKYLLILIFFLGLSLNEFVRSQQHEEDAPQLEPWCNRSKNNVICDEKGVPIPLDLKSECGRYTMKYLNHVTSCQFNTITELKMPLKDSAQSVLKFNKFGALWDDRFTLFCDLETTNTPVPALCQICYEKYNKAPSNLGKKKIVEDCKNQKHKPDTALSCGGCYRNRLRHIKKVFCKCKNEKCGKNEENSCKECEKKTKKIKRIIKHCMDCASKESSECATCVRYKIDDGENPKYVKCSHSNTKNVIRLDPIHSTLSLIHI